MFPESCGSVSQRSSSEQITLSNGQGIKYRASIIRKDQNLYVIRDNGGKMAKSVQEEKEKKSWKTMEIRMVELFFFSGEITLLITKQASAVFREKTDLVSSVQLVLISLTKSHHIYDLLFINNQED